MHISVLLNECIDNLNLKDNSIIVDCTLGYAGHSSEILKKIPKGYLYAFDQDNNAITSSKERLSKINSNFEIINTNFVNLYEEVHKRSQEVNGILYDLGVSSPQLDVEERGFSFHNDAKLDMRMDQNNPLSAYEVVNNYTKEELTNILYKYGEEKYASSIASKIVNYRENKKIETTLELVEIIKTGVPEKYRREKHPARKTFQAIRIEVNHELDVFESSLRQALELISVGGRICVITFHSLEDRIVKNVFKELTTIDPIVKGMPNIPSNYLPDYELVNNKAIVPSNLELEDNNRSRSSKLRVLRRIK